MNADDALWVVLGLAVAWLGWHLYQLAIEWRAQARARRAKEPQ